MAIIWLDPRTGSCWGEGPTPLGRAGLTGSELGLPPPSDSPQSYWGGAGLENPPPTLSPQMPVPQPLWIVSPEPLPEVLSGVLWRQTCSPRGAEQLCVPTPAMCLGV